jgi:hypothetical protein
MAFGWIWGWFLAAIIVQEESATLSQLLGGVWCGECFFNTRKYAGNIAWIVFLFS